MKTKQTLLAAVILSTGLLTAIITRPVLADSISDATQAKVKLSNAKQDEEQSKKSSGSTVDDPEKKDGDCQ